MSYKHRYYNKGSFEVELMLYEADDDGIIDREGPDRVTLSIPAEWVYEGETFDKEGQLREALAWAIDNEYPTKIYKIIETRSPKDEVILKGWQEFDEDVFEKGGQLAMAKAMRGVAQRGESKISAERQQIKQMRGFQAEARKTIDKYKKGIKDTEKSIKTYDKAIRDNKKEMLETYNEVEKAKKEAVKYDEGGKVYSPEEMAYLIKRKGWRFSDNEGLYEIATNLGYKWNGRHWVDENDNPYYAKGGKLNTLGIEDESVRDHMYKADQHLRSIGSKLWRNKHPKELKYRKAKEKFDESFDDLFPGRVLAELGYAKGGSVKEPESEDEPKVVRYYFEDEEFEYAKGGKLRTNSKEVREKVREHIKDSVYDENEEEFDTFDKASEYLVEDFKRVADYPNNLKRIPNNQDRFQDYLQGIPFYFEYENYKIEEFLNSLGINPENKEYDSEKMWRLYSYLIWREIEDDYYKYAKGGRILVGRFDEKQLKNKEDKKAIDKAQKESGLKYIDSKIIKKGGKMFMEVYLIPNEEYYKSSKFANGGDVDQWYDIYDEETGKTLYFRGTSLEEAEEESDSVDFNEYEDGEYVYARGGKVKKKQNNEMLIGGIAGILLGIFLNR